MSDFSRLDYLIASVIEDGDHPMSAIIARAELSALRAQIAAQGEALAQIVTLTTDYAPDTVAHMINGLARAAMTGEEQPVTLTPRNCEACRKGQAMMREAAAKVADSKAITVRNYNAIAAIVLEDCEYDIRALPLADCGDCNPLKPTEPRCDCGAPMRLVCSGNCERDE